MWLSNKYLTFLVVLTQFKELVNVVLAERFLDNNGISL